MANDRLPDPSDPEAVGRAEFGTQFRGFDQLQVRSYLKVVARELQRSKDREVELSREIDGLRKKLSDAEAAANDFDESALTARLGEETTRVLEAARSAAAEKRRRADESASETLASAKSEAERIVGGAQAAVDAELDLARARGRELVAEARLLREQTLEDLARRRRTIRTQVEQLRSGRDRLLATHAELRNALDHIERELERELPEARVAAELTGRRLQHEPSGSAALIEIELDAAREAGAPLVSADDLAARLEQHPADWINRGVVTPSDDDEQSADVAAPHVDEPTDEIPVLDHFGDGDHVARPEIVLAEVGNRKRDHRDLPRDPVPVIEAPDDVEAVRVVSDAQPDSPADEPDPVELDAAGTMPVETEAVEPHLVVDDDASDDVPEHPREASTADDAADATDEAGATVVDDLFARIRESRAETVARAREVLDQPLTSAVAVADPPVADAEAALVSDTEAEPADDLTPDGRRIAARDVAVADIEGVVVRKLKRLLADEQNDIQDLVRRQQGKIGHDDVLGSREHHVGRYVAAVGGELLAAVSAGASFYDPDAHAGDTDLSALDERLAQELLDPLRQLLGRGVDDAAGDEDELLDRVRSAYREIKSQRVETAARVVTLSAFNLGIVTSQPEGAWLRWAVDPAGCSPDCGDNELAGAVVAGEPFPTGVTYPPNHPGCRCLLVPADEP
jgi:cell division septum initiation protein DivIVA